MKTDQHSINPFFYSLGFGIKTISLVLGTFFLATILEWIGQHCWWQNASEHRLAERTQFELQNIEDSCELSKQTNGLRWMYREVTTVSDRILAPLERYLKTQQQKLGRAPDSMSAVVDSVVQIQKFINKHFFIAIDVFRAWLFRLVVFVSGVVTVLPFLMVGIIDGLVRREIRRWTGGHESSWLFTFASKSFIPSIAVFFVFFVLWPTKISVIWINVTMGIVWGCTLSLALAKFKKYL